MNELRAAIKTALSVGKALYSLTDSKPDPAHHLISDSNSARAGQRLGDLQRSALAAVLLLAFSLSVFSCATNSLSQSEVASHPERAYLAFSTSTNENDTEAVELVSSSGRTRDLSTTGSPLTLADENFFFVELDPKQAYAFTKARNGNFSSRIDGGKLRQIRLEPGTITYVGSFMLWASGESFYSDVLLTEAKADSGASHALKAAFPKRKIRFGFAP